MLYRVGNLNSKRILDDIRNMGHHDIPRYMNKFHLYTVRLVRKVRDYSNQTVMDHVLVVELDDSL